eukprot:2002631-Prymnesium_polylepis.1
MRSAASTVDTTHEIGVRMDDNTDGTRRVRHGGGLPDMCVDGRVTQCVMAKSCWLPGAQKTKRVRLCG